MLRYTCYKWVEGWMTTFQIASTCFFWLFICTPGGRERCLTGIVLEAAFHCGKSRYPSEGGCFIFQRCSKTEQTEINLISKSHTLNRERRHFSSTIVRSHWLYICKKGYIQRHEVGAFCCSPKIYWFICSRMLLAVAQKQNSEVALNWRFIVSVKSEM